MKHPSALFTTVALAVLLGTPAAVACGDKFILGPSGSQINRVRPASQPARVLIYREAGASTSQALGDPALEDTLKKAGHSTSSAATVQDLERALSLSDYDLVLADYQMATTLRGQLGTKVPGTRIVPVLDRDTRQFLSAAKREFKVVLNIPASVNSLLNAVDRAMALR